MSDLDVAGKSVLTKTGDREIRVERVFDAPRERVFRAYTDPELIPQWWGPHGSTTRVDELDLKPGGRWQFAATNPDGSEIVFRGVFREVLEPERVAWTFEWDGMPGHVSVDVVSFEDLGDRTRAVSVSYFHRPEELEGMIESGMEKGMNETYERLDQLLATGGA